MKNRRKRREKVSVSVTDLMLSKTRHDRGQEQATAGSLHLHTDKVHTVTLHYDSSTTTEKLYLDMYKTTNDLRQSFNCHMTMRMKLPISPSAEKLET